MKAVSILRPAAWAGVATLALGMQAALAAPLVYVPLGGKGKIVVVDAAKDEIVDTIGGITAVHGLAETPDGRFLIAGSLDQREAGSAAPEKPSGITAQDHAAHHAAAPSDSKMADSKMADSKMPDSKKADSKMAGCNMDDAVVSTVSVIRTADKSIVRRIDVPGAVHHVAVSPNGQFAVVTQPKNGTISAIDLTSFTVVATVATGPKPNYVVFSPDGSQVYVSNAGNGTISAIDTSRWTVQWSTIVGTSPEHVVLSGDGTTLYVNNVDDGTVSVLSLQERKVVKTITIGSTLHGIDLSDDGKTLYVVARGEEKIVSVDLATGTMRSRALAPEPYHLAVIRGTGKLYVSSAGAPKMWALDQKSIAVLKEIPIGGRGHQMAQGAGG